MSELCLLTDQELELKSKELDKQFFELEKQITLLTRERKVLMNEVTARRKMARIVVVKEYKEKLKSILSRDEYTIVMNGMDRQEYSSGKMLFIDIEEIYEHINKYKTMFSNIQLTSLRISMQQDYLPPVSAYCYTFTFNDRSDVIIKYGSCFVFNSRSLNDVIWKLNSYEWYLNLDYDEKELIAYYISKYAESEYSQIMFKIQEIRELYPEMHISGINGNEEYIVWIC